MQETICPVCGIGRLLSSETDIYLHCTNCEEIFELNKFNNNLNVISKEDFEKILYSNIHNDKF